MISKSLLTHVSYMFLDDEDESVSDEIVEDPFVSNEAFGLPKKASLKALLNEPDPLVLATAITKGFVVSCLTLL